MKILKIGSLFLPGVLLMTTLPASAQDETITYTYQCEEGQTFQAEFLPESALMLVDDEAVVLPQVRSASGVRYSDGSTTLYTKGEEAFVEVDGEVAFENCLAQATTPTQTDTTEVEEPIAPEPSAPSSAPSSSTPDTESSVTESAPSSLSAPALW